jgi:2-keto-4-pentenoate hydratase/2-oxohepta-3-ene-1,7-dioic acid hydratase in catechol pathway
VTTVNGQTVQDGSMSDMVFSVARLVSFLSRRFELRPGDVIATGAPNGAGYVRNPPWLLQPGDTVEVNVDRWVP